MSQSLQDRVVAAIGDQYEIDCEIGRGGMAVVYRATDRRLKRAVAVKVLPPELAYDPAIRTRFTREAQTSAQLAHPHIVPIYDVGERDGIAYFVMALVTGGTLGTLLANEPRQPIEEARRVLCEVADALAYAHLRGVIHRDVKPDNILLDGDSGRALVTDFGIARAMEAGTRLTITGNAVGTPTYMSPEQATGEREVDGRSDIYSLGVLAYQMVTGRVPFAAGNSMALLLKHVTERPRPIAELRPDAPRGLQEAIERAMMKSPEDRWPTASALRDALSATRAPNAAWRTENREPVRYDSPRPASRRAPGGAAVPDAAFVEPLPQPSPVAPMRDDLVLEPPHLAALTKEQRADLRLWHGRIGLMERIKGARQYALLTLVAFAGAITGIAIEPESPTMLGVIVPAYMSWKLWRRGSSLHRAGVRRRRVFLMPLARWVLPGPPAAPTKRQLNKLAPQAIMEGPEGQVVRRAAEDRAAIVDIHRKLSKADRAMLPEVVATADALLERVGNLAEAMHRLDESIDPELVPRLDARIAAAEWDADSTEGGRRIGLLRRQKETMEELIAQRALLARQFESAGLALGNLRLDLVRYRASGLESSLRELALATQQGRALSRDIGLALEAIDEVRSL